MIMDEGCVGWIDGMDGMKKLGMNLEWQNRDEKIQTGFHFIQIGKRSRQKVIF